MSTGGGAPWDPAAPVYDGAAGTPRAPRPVPPAVPNVAPSAGADDPSTDAPPALIREFAVLARYLGARGNIAPLGTTYARAHRSLPRDGDDRLGRWLAESVRFGSTAVAVADAYARLVRPYGLLRRKLTLALAVLESSALTHDAFDSALPAGAAATWLALVALGTRWAARTAVALIVFVPLHLAATVLAAAGGAGAPGGDGAPERRAHGERAGG